MPRDIIAFKATTIFPGTSDDVMLDIQTEKTDYCFNIPHDIALTTALKMIEKAIPDLEKRCNYLRAIIGDK